MNRTQAESMLRQPNVKAFLDVIAYSEGANYNTLFGGETFSDLSRHPQRVIRKSGYASSAAGRYQFLARTWAGVASKLGLTDFSPHSQDLGAVLLLHQRGALPPLLAGNFPAAVSAARKEWASFPGAGYGQPERKLSQLQSRWNAQIKGLALVAVDTKPRPLLKTDTTHGQPQPSLVEEAQRRLADARRLSNVASYLTPTNIILAVVGIGLIRYLSSK